MPGTAPPNAAAMLASAAAFWKAAKSATPGPDLATHTDPEMIMRTSFIISAACGGIDPRPAKSAMLIAILSAYSSHEAPPIARDLPVGFADASIFAPAPGFA